MRVLFVHQNMPAQFEHVARHLARDPDNHVLFLTCRRDRPITGVHRIVYERPKPWDKMAETDVHPYLRPHSEFLAYGQGAANALAWHKKETGYRPDLIVAHPGWGEPIFLKDVYPDVPLLDYCEFYYRAFGADRNFFKDESENWDHILETRIANTHLLHAIAASDWAYCPTEWQKKQHPVAFQPRISVIHDGVDTNRLYPSPSARYVLADGRALSPENEVVTFAVRNLERVRGFDIFMRAVPEICRRRPNAQIVIAGGDNAGYGRSPREGGTWRAKMLKEVKIDPMRVHFVGFIPFDRLIGLMQVSTVHVYSTIPFVLSWSMLMAMSCGAVVVASNTAPVAEIIKDGENGLLFEYFEVEQLVDRTVTALEKRAAMLEIRKKARQTIERSYSIDMCLPRQLKLLRQVAERVTPTA